MTSNTFFKLAKNQFEEALPFVLYKKPNTQNLKGIFQENDTVYYSENLNESGFIFSPFNDEEGSVLIPLEHSELINISYTNTASIEHQLEHAESDTSAEAEPIHIQLVSKAIQSINNNQFKKVVVSRKETVNLKETNAIELFKRLLQTYTSAFVYCWYHPKIGLWLGATPETLISIVGNRFTTMSLAGTQALTKNPVWEAKETEEQQLVTQFIVDQITPKVEQLTVGNTETVQAGNLLHLKTKISGILSTGIFDIVRALHPTPAVCGLPKDITKQFILTNENYHRAFYTGFLGELNFKEELQRNRNKRNVENSAYNAVKTVSHLYVNLRCMQLTDTKAHIYVGGGITKDSNPKKEYLETVHKAATMKKVLF